MNYHEVDLLDIFHLAPEEKGVSKIIVNKQTNAINTFKDILEK